MDKVCCEPSRRPLKLWGECINCDPAPCLDRLKNSYTLEDNSDGANNCKSLEHRTLPISRARSSTSSRPYRVHSLVHLPSQNKTRPVFNAIKRRNMKFQAAIIGLLGLSASSVHATSKYIRAKRPAPTRRIAGKC